MEESQIIAAQMLESLFRKMEVPDGYDQYLDEPEPTGKKYKSVQITQEEIDLAKAEFYKRRK